MKETKFNFKYISAISLVSALGGLLFGYDWVVIGGAKPFYELFFDIASNPQFQGWAMSSALVGCIIGVVISGMLSDKYGRKKLLILAAALFLSSAIGTGYSSNFTIFIMYRIIGGVGIGLASNLSPVYIAEIAPYHLRGRFVAINQLTIVIGILLAQIINWMIAEPVSATATSSEILNSWNGQIGWRFMFWAEAIPASLFFLLMWFVPDSPRWMVAQDNSKKAFSVLQRIGGENYASTVVFAIQESINKTTSKISSRELLKKPLFQLIILGIVLAVFQQWCGINIIFLYAQEIFASAGYSVSETMFNVVVTGSVNLVFTILAMALVDKVGRKALLKFGSIGLAIVYTVIGFLYKMEVQGLFLLILILVAIGIYAMSLAPVVWVVLSEMFPNKHRGTAMAIATFALWTSNILLVYFFPIINSSISISGSFWLFAVICLLGFVFVHYKINETKGKSLEEIEDQL